jgi:glycosyltransferase involved in cell wall biosynthesis
MIFFSVIIPLYNKSEYVKRCLESVLHQSYENFEIVIVNDGSTDGGELIVDKLKSENVTLINQSNQGVSVARNTGVELSRYEYVVFLDADDTWEKDFLLELDKLINKFPDAGVYGINHFNHYSSGLTTYENYTSMFNGDTSGIILDYFRTFAELGKSPFSNSSCCFPKNIFQNIGGYKPGIKTTEDSDLWCRIALSFNVAFHTKPLATYYLETPNNTRNILEDKDFQVSRTLQEYLVLKKIPKKYIPSVQMLIAFQQLSIVKRAILTDNTKFALKKLFDLRLIIRYPLKAFSLFFIALVPHRFFRFFRALINRNS